jgi:hypothetical protein
MMINPELRAYTQGYADGWRMAWAHVPDTVKRWLRWRNARKVAVVVEWKLAERKMAAMTAKWMEETS